MSSRDDILARVRRNQPAAVALPDVPLFDAVVHDFRSNLERMGGEFATSIDLRKKFPEAKVIVMGLLPSQEDVAHYVRAGASGFVMKDASFEEFFTTIRAVASGAQVLPKQLTKSLFSQIALNVPVKDKKQLLESVRLTAREHQVIDLLGEGLSNKEIAARLHIAVHTVKSHVHNVLEKLALHSRLEVAAFSHAAGGSRAISK